MPPLCPVGAPALGVDRGLTQTWPTCWARAGHMPPGLPCSGTRQRAHMGAQGQNEVVLAGAESRAPAAGGDGAGSEQEVPPFLGHTEGTTGPAGAGGRRPTGLGGPQHGHRGCLGPPPRSSVEKLLRKECEDRVSSRRPPPPLKLLPPRAPGSSVGGVAWSHPGPALGPEPAPVSCVPFHGRLSLTPACASLQRTPAGTGSWT